MEADIGEAGAVTTLAADLGKVEIRVAKVEEATTKRLNKVDKRMDSMREDITGLSNRHDIMAGSLEELAAEMECISDRQIAMMDSMEAGFAKHQAAEARLAALAGKEAGQQPLMHDDSSSAFYITGIPVLRSCLARLLGLRADPVAVLVQLLKDVGAATYINRVQLVGLGVRQDRLSARAAIVHMTTIFHKDTALARIKTLLASHRVQQVYVEDCFPASKAEEARQLRETGLRLKSSGAVDRFRVINRQGTPVLQTARARKDRYADHTLSPTTATGSQGGGPMAPMFEAG